MSLSKEPLIEPDFDNRSLTLREYARTRQLTENQVWELIEDGNLSARFLNDNIFVFQESKGEHPAIDTLVDTQNPNPLQVTLLQDKSKCLVGDLREEFNEKSFDAIDISIEGQNRLEIDFDSYRKSIEIFEKLLKSKDDIIALKDEKIALLEAKIEGLEVKTKHINRELENYATLHKITQNPSILRNLLSDDDSP